MLEMIREYALELLVASGQATGIRRAHADIFLSLAEAAEAELEGTQQAAWLSRLQQEHITLKVCLNR